MKARWKARIWDSWGGRDSVGMTPCGERFDLIATLNVQSRLNSWAAKAAAMAAMLQGINALLPNAE